jgi:hypothetical protein
MLLPAVVHAQPLEVHPRMGPSEAKGGILPDRVV